ncbi:hypothetical protein [Terriglobus sp. TAA 43]|uniref:hypothetical protein n=1 Tax=Terriglobus sp. TAA 43 TaxID=278961 RepID=UPI0012ECDC54|nr:hypothetical protein [Terriglobus sp. TAA 43]
MLLHEPISDVSEHWLEHEGNLTPQRAAKDLQFFCNAGRGHLLGGIPYIRLLNGKKESLPEEVSLCESELLPHEERELPRGRRRQVLEPDAISSDLKQIPFELGVSIHT